jgi:sensor histidine kinase YesM
MTPLREELRTLELYAQIMQERFADRVSIAWQVDEDALEASTPVLLLQPLLENAFKHGVERSVGPVSIEVTARRSEDAVVIAIRNTGSTLARDYRHGVGLRNCRERLSVIYGAAASLQLFADGDAVVAKVNLPRPGQAA